MDSTFHGSLRHQLRGIMQEGDARVKARATVEHHGIILRTGGQNHSFLSLRMESGFVLWRRESYSLCSGIIPQTAGELLPPHGHISSKEGNLMDFEDICRSPRS